MLGYVPFNDAFQGNYIGGNVNNPLGASATNAVLVGGNYSTVMTPSGIVKWHINDEFYNLFGLNRSTPGSLAPTVGFSGNALAVESYTNHSGLNVVNSHPCVFGNCHPSPGVVLTDEVGYRTEAAPGVPYTWVRAEGYVNVGTNYYNLQRNNGAQTNAFSASIFADRQLWQAEPDSPHTAYKGLYVGMTFGYNNREQATYTQDYEARIYTLGMFNRPRDQIAISSQHLAVSPYWASDMNQYLGCASTHALCARHAVNSYTLTYTAYIMPGVYFSLGANYTDHPSVVWSPLASRSGSAAVPSLAPYNIQGALNFQAALVTVF
jgi:porin